MQRMMIVVFVMVMVQLMSVGTVPLYAISLIVQMSQQQILLKYYLIVMEIFMVFNLQ